MWGKMKERDFTQRIRRTQRAQRAQRRDERETRSAEEREDKEVAFAGDDYGDGAAVGGDGEIAEGEPVKDGDGRGLGDGNFIVRGDRRERREFDPDEVAGFFF